MSKIINKKQLDVLIESTLKEFYYPKTDDELRSQSNYDPSGINTYGYFPERDNEPSQKKSNEPSQEEIDSATNYISYMKDKMCECGGMVYEGTCNECGTSYMKKGKKEEKIKNPGKYINGPRTEAGIDDDGDGVPNRADKKPKDGNVTEASVKDLAESVTKTFNPSFLTENMDNFKKLINYRNK
jgi:hypothetical protein